MTIEIYEYICVFVSELESILEKDCITSSKCVTSLAEEWFTRACSLTSVKYVVTYFPYLYGTFIWVAILLLPQQNYIIRIRLQMSSFNKFILFASQLCLNKLWQYLTRHLSSRCFLLNLSLFLWCFSPYAGVIMISLITVTADAFPDSLKIIYDAYNTASVFGSAVILINVSAEAHHTASKKVLSHFLILLEMTTSTQ